MSDFRQQRLEAARSRTTTAADEYQSRLDRHDGMSAAGLAKKHRVSQYALWAELHRRGERRRCRGGLTRCAQRPAALRTRVGRSRLRALAAAGAYRAALDDATPCSMSRVADEYRVSLKTLDGALCDLGEIRRFDSHGNVVTKPELADRIVAERTAADLVILYPHLMNVDSACGRYGVDSTDVRRLIRARSA